MTAYAKTLGLFLALCAGVALADSPKNPGAERAKVLGSVESVSTVEAVEASRPVRCAPPVDDQITQLRNEVRWLSSEVSRAPKYFKDPEDDKLRP